MLCYVEVNRHGLLRSDVLVGYCNGAYLRVEHLRCVVDVRHAVSCRCREGDFPCLCGQVVHAYRRTVCKVVLALAVAAEEGKLVNVEHARISGGIAEAHTVVHAPLLIDVPYVCGKCLNGVHAVASVGIACGVV